jgi:hypothetical protein
MILDIYWKILTMHGPINVKSPNNISKWQMGFNSAFKGLTRTEVVKRILKYIFKIIFIHTYSSNDMFYVLHVDHLQGWYGQV